MAYFASKRAVSVPIQGSTCTTYYMGKKTRLQWFLNCNNQELNKEIKKEALIKLQEGFQNSKHSNKNILGLEGSVRNSFHKNFFIQIIVTHINVLMCSKRTVWLQEQHSENPGGIRYFVSLYIFHIYLWLSPTHYTRTSGSKNKKTLPKNSRTMQGLSTFHMCRQ